MKRIRQVLILSSLLLCTNLLAGPVHNKSVTLRQRDGKPFRAIINGDEFFSTIRDAEGNVIVRDSEGNWCYASFAPDGSRYSSGYIVGEYAPPDILYSSRNVPSSAVQSERRSNLQRVMRREAKLSASHKPLKVKVANALPEQRNCAILLVEFADKKMTYTKSDFVEMITAKGYSKYGADGSIKDYLDHQLGGDMEFSFQVSDIITLDNNCKSYFGNNGKDSDINAAAAVAEACQKASNAGIDFSLCDGDGDGEVDNVFLFVAGMDEADGGGEDCVWSHMYYLELSQFKNLALNGKIINSYAISTELRVTDQDETLFTSIGSFCHEYGHVLGLMDMYDTDYSGSGGQGNGLWMSTNLMDGGNGNNNFNTPPNYNAINYDSIGLGNPEMLQAGHYELEAIDINKRFLKMETANPGEYYLIECRDNKGWDAYIGGKGLLIYHIDKSTRSAGQSDWYGGILSAADRWEYNEVNCRPSRQCAKLIAATDGIQAYNDNGNYNGNSSFVFFPSATNDAFSPMTEPAFVFWDGTSSPFALTEIAMEGDKVSFNVSKISELVLPEVVLRKSDIFQNTAIIQWESSISDYEESAYLSLEVNDEIAPAVEIKPYSKGKYACRLEDLKPTTAYKVNIVFKESGMESKEYSISFTTKRLYNNYPFIFLNNVERQESGAFSQDAMLPLVVYNLKESDRVKWYMGKYLIEAGDNGYYKLRGSGTLKAVITHDDGSEDILIKELIVK